MSLLDVEGLSVTTRDGERIVDDVSFSVARGESLALAGESGCGKTTTALSLLRLLPPGLEQTGKITLQGETPINIGRRTETGMRLVRWRHLSLVFQGAMNALNPVQTVERQIGEAIRLHGSDAVVSDLLALVGLPASVGARYAHQLSGGQRQRVMIALALSCRPALVIADEPTTALDVVMQAQVLQLLARLREELGLALILISHDLGVVAETCERIAVMHAGKIVETGPVATVFTAPRNEYTRKLLGSLPVIGGERPAAAQTTAAPSMEVTDLHVRYGTARALDGVSLTWAPGEILGVVGESGCGKSTLARALMGLQKTASGTIRGQEGQSPLSTEWRRRFQMIFQDPYQTLNPRQKVRAIVAEPLVVQRVPRGEHGDRIARAMSDVGLEARFLDRYPHQLSGGQRQRVAIAAALVLEPEGLICDEPVSMLDVSVRTQILDVLQGLRQSRGLGLVFITHDLGLAWSLCDRIAVMYLGRVVEEGPAVDVIERPQHPYTQALVDAIPVPVPGGGGRRELLGGELPDPNAVPSGCRFHPRCPKRFEPCDTVDPPLFAAGPQRAACLLHRD